MFEVSTSPTVGKGRSDLERAGADVPVRSRSVTTPAHPCRIEVITLAAVFAIAELFRPADAIVAPSLVHIQIPYPDLQRNIYAGGGTHDGRCFSGTRKVPKVSRPGIVYWLNTRRPRWGLCWPSDRDDAEPTDSLQMQDCAYPSNRCACLALRCESRGTRPH